VSGSNDAGIYVGQSNQAIIRNNLAYDNTIGIEIENTINVETRNNVTRDNSVGVVGIVLPGRSIAMTDIVSIVENEIYNNNRLNPVTDPMDVISRLPSGIGILLIATDNVDVFGNSVLNNGSVGIGLLSLAADLAALDTRINPTPDNNSIFNNIVLGNGTNPDPKLALLGLPARDLLWDGTGTGNGWANNQFGTSFPRTLPGLSVAVPEPATWMLLLLGFGAVGYSMRSRRVGYKALQVD
jgi:parallel beta-helix repeat protein